jgi:hypothetical protein
MEDTLAIALELARLGLRVIPCKDKAGIHNWPTRATTWEKQIREWFTGRYRGYNLGVVLGDEFLLVDLDTKKNGPANWAIFVAGRPFPKTLETATPTGGKHLYLRADPSIVLPSQADLLAAGIDIWSGTRLVIAPPSLHPMTRTQYRFAEQPEWSQGESLIAEAPGWLLDELATPIRRVKTGRHGALLSHATRIRREGGLDADEIVLCLQMFQQSQGFSKPDSELYKLATWVREHVPFDPAGVTSNMREAEVEGQAVLAGLEASFQNFSVPAITGNLIKE